MFSRAMPGTGLRKYRATGPLPGAPRDAARLLWDADERMRWDATYAAIEQLGAVASDGDAGGVGAGGREDEIVLQRLCVRSVLVVSQRDFVCCHMRTDRARDGVIRAVSYAASEEDGLTPVDPAYVRGEVLEGSGWSVRPVAGPAGEQHAEMCYTVFLDLRGWIPHWVVNAAIGSTFAKYFSLLSSHLEAASAD
jgi:hypothetical protein